MEQQPRMTGEELRAIIHKAYSGDPDARFEVGGMYMMIGDAMTRDYKEAATWFKLAAEQGHIGARLYLSVLTDRLSRMTETDDQGGHITEPDINQIRSIAPCHHPYQHLLFRTNHDLLAETIVLKQRILEQQEVEEKRKRVEAALRDNVLYLKSVFRAIQSGIVVIDAETHTIVDANNKAIEMIGTGMKETIGSICHESICPLGKGECPITDLGQETDHSEHILIAADGSRRPIFRSIASVMLSGRTYLIESFIDITERKRAQEERERAERLCRTLAKHTQSAIHIVRDGCFRFVNPYVSVCSGYEKSELLGMKTVSLIHPEDRDIARSNAIRMIKGDLSSPYEFRMITKDGNIRWMMETNTPVEFEGDHALLMNAMDITDQKRADEERIALKKQLIQAQKMEAIGTLAGGIVHDFNNILMAVVGYTELAIFKATEGHVVISYLQQILMAVDRARDLVKQILAFSRQQDQDRIPLSITPIVKETLKLIQSSVPSTIEIRQSYAKGHDVVLADPTQIHQVVMNLCTNAAHAMQDREGVLEVHIDRQEIFEDRPLHGLELKAGNYIRISVRDNGEGINPVIKDQIFEPFFTTKKPGVGTGLGLSIVLGIVKFQGGDLIVDSILGEGTTITVLLPLIDAVVPLESQKPAAYPRGSGSILLIDDEEQIASLSKDILTSLGYDVSVYCSSQQALEAFRAYPDKYDLLITDTTMPNVTGICLAKEVLKIRPGFPIIMATGSSGRINEEEAKNIGIREFIMKPFSLPIIAQLVKRLIDGEACSDVQKKSRSQPWMGNNNLIGP